MDLKALIAKMDLIEKKQILNEDAKITKTSSGGTVTKTATGSVHKAGPKGYGNKWDGETQDQAPAKPSKAAKSAAEKKADKAKDIKLPPWKGNVTRHSSNKGAEKDDGTGDLEESTSFKGSIANELLKEFGLDERVTINPDGSVSGGFKPSPTTNPAVSGEFKFSPEQEKWLGGANRQDPYILNRMPGNKPPINYFKDPADQALAKRMGFPAQAAAPAAPAAPAAAEPAAEPRPSIQLPATSDKPTAAPTGVQAQGDDEGNTTITRPDGSTMVVGPDGNAIKPGSNPNLPQNKPTAAPAAPAAAAAPGLDQAKVQRFTELLDKIKKGGAGAAKPASKPATSGQPAAPAGGATMPGVDAMGNVTGMPMSEDDYILKLIKSK